MARKQPGKPKKPNPRPLDVVFSIESPGAGSDVTVRPDGKLEVVVRKLAAIEQFFAAVLPADAAVPGEPPADSVLLTLLAGDLYHGWVSAGPVPVQLAADPAPTRQVVVWPAEGDLVTRPIRARAAATYPNITVDARNALWFAWAPAGYSTPFGEQGDAFRPVPLVVPTDAVAINLQTDNGLWGHQPTGHDSDANGYGLSRPLEYPADYQNAALKAQNIQPYANATGPNQPLPLNRLVGMWGIDETVAANELSVGKEPIRLALPGGMRPTVFFLAFHDGYQWVNNHGQVRVTVTWERPAGVRRFASEEVQIQAPVLNSVNAVNARGQVPVTAEYVGAGSCSYMLARVVALGTVPAAPNANLLAALNEGWTKLEPGANPRIFSGQVYAGPTALAVLAPGDPDNKEVYVYPESRNNPDSRAFKAHALANHGPVSISAKQALWFAYADFGYPPRPEFGEEGDLYRPVPLAVPTDARSVTLTTSADIWQHGDPLYFASNADGTTWSSNLNSSHENKYRTGDLNSTNIVGANLPHNKLVGMWGRAAGDQAAATGLNQELAVGLGAALNVPPEINAAFAMPTRLFLGHHDSYEWSNNDQMVTVTVVWSVNPVALVAEAAGKKARKSRKKD